MIISSKIIQHNGNTLLLRCPEAQDAQLVLDGLIAVCGETRFLRNGPEEIRFTLEEEAAFLENYNQSANSLMLLAFVNGEYAGNCSFTVPGPSRRNAHRCALGIALLQKHTHQGYGTKMLEQLIFSAKEAGFRQCELSVVSTNTHAIGLYEKLGFVACGRIPHANRYDDGSESDDIWMVLEI